MTITLSAYKYVYKNISWHWVIEHRICQFFESEENLVSLGQKF